MATEDYLRKPLGFKVQKVLRYVELYGPMKTLAKVRGQLHMAKADGFSGIRRENPDCVGPDDPRRCVGLIGCGSFGFGSIAYHLRRRQARVLAGVMDTSAPRAWSLAKTYEAAFATTDAEQIIRSPRIRLVYVASNHATHAEYAIAALDAGKHVHIEKPHVVSHDQLRRLDAAMKRNPHCMVFLGFNRPKSATFARLRQEMARESGPSMINWFIAGHAIDDDHWYFKDQEGGRILGNLCHWTDLSLEMVGIDNAFPARVVPTAAAGAKSDFVTSIAFADGSLATLSFSAKGHTFEGVRETLNLHKGDLLAEIKDFRSIAIVRGAKRHLIRSLFRDHGHEANITNTYDGAIGGNVGKAPGPRAIIATATLFLAVHDAHKQGTPVTATLPSDI